MNIYRLSLAIVTVFMLFIMSSCRMVTSSPQPGEPESTESPKAPLLINTPLPTETPIPTATATLHPTAIPELTQEATSVSTQAVKTELVQRLCPELQAPLGLFSISGPVYDTSVDPTVLYVPYDVIELSSDPSTVACTLYLSPAPMGIPQFAGETLFWKSFDQEQEEAMVWKYDLNDSLVDNVFPQHPSLRQTRTNTSIGKAGLYDFVVAESGETLVWTYTDPQPYDDNTMGYARSMYGSPTSGPIDQRPPVELMFDFLPENPSGACVLRPRKLSMDESQVYFSLEPVGLGTTWPEPLGRFTSLYSINVDWDSSPELVYDCGREYWCISDFSEEHDILISMLDGTIQIFGLSGGELIREVKPPETYPLVRQAMIGPGGTIAFLGVAMGEPGLGGSPEGAAIFILEPLYQAEPILVLEDAGMLNLIGWAGPGLLLVNGNDLAKNSTPGITHTDLMLLKVETGVSQWLPHNTAGFVSLIP